MPPVISKEAMRLDQVNKSFGDQDIDLHIYALKKIKVRTGVREEPKQKRILSCSPFNPNYVRPAPPIVYFGNSDYGYTTITDLYDNNPQPTISVQRSTFNDKNGESSSLICTEELDDDDEFKAKRRLIF